jgi:hypothetical protein
VTTTTRPAVAETAAALRDLVAGLPGPVALVPTMGALHEGHRELVRAARARAGSVVVSVFVNPTQFGPGEDLDRYPRTWDADLAALTEEGADAVFHPPVDEVYPPGALGVTVDPGPLGGVLEGALRPGHFAGVLTVVAKLFGLTRPGLALFGEKDYQQLTLIRAMVRELALPVQVVGVPPSARTTAWRCRAATATSPRKSASARRRCTGRCVPGRTPARRAPTPSSPPPARCWPPRRNWSRLPVAHRPRPGPRARGRPRPPAGRPSGGHPTHRQHLGPAGRPPMMRTMLKSKIHRATVTQADLHYVGSVTIDEDLLDAADLLPGEQVAIVDVTNGAGWRPTSSPASAAAASSASTAPPRTSCTPATWSS